MTYNHAAHSGQVRIGNWFEELKLKEDTGIRFYPSPTDKKNSLLTKDRCIVHTDQLLPKDYSSVTRDTLIPPQSHPEFRGFSNGSKAVGPRRLMIENTIRAEVDEEFSKKDQHKRDEARKTDYRTVYKSTFTKDNFEASLKEFDATSRIPTKNAGYVTEPPITYYSYATAKGVGADFPCTFVGSTNPFKRNNAFTSNIRTDLTAPKGETSSHPRPLPTLLELRVLNDLRTRLLTAFRRRQGGDLPNGGAVRALIAAIWRGSEEPLAAVGEVVEALQNSAGIRITAEEVRALLTAMEGLGPSGEGKLDLARVTDWLRPSPSPRRLVTARAYSAHYT